MVRNTCLIIGIALLVLQFGTRAEEGAKPKKILYFSKSARFEHDVVRQTGGNPSFSEKILKELGAKNNFEITTTKDGGVFTAENLAKYDAIMFYTSGDLLVEKSKDGSPPMTKEGKTLLLETVKAGKPFIAIHNALATFDKGSTVDPYIEMIGGESIGHGKQQKGVNTCNDTKFPGFEGLKDGLNFTEEWYSIKNFSKDLHVILTQQPQGMEGALYLRPPYPATWAHMFGKGRVFVTSLGHREDVWTNPDFQNLLAGGIKWALGVVDADITPNIDTVTPQYATLPGKGEK